MQEFDEKLCAKTGNKWEEPEPAEGQEQGPKVAKNKAGAGTIMNNTYRIVLSRHDEPQIEVTGHYWEIIEFYKIGESRMIA